ncbi:MAG: helix-turn-helix transcriptional regulator [Clostridia bacterium]|nr:helix-turn-helix transcriptional regulator [Clostridia bacterium]
MTVQERRKEKGLTQQELAVAAGVKISTLQKIERAASMPLGTSVEVAVRLARVLGCCVEDLVEIDM